MSNSKDACYLSLLALAEKFRTQDPSNIKASVQCLQAVLTFSPPPKVEARTHLQLGNLLVQYTKNEDLALNHLEQAWNLSVNIMNFDDVRFESAGELAKLYQKTAAANKAKSILRRATDLSQQSTFWHCRLLFISSQISIKEGDYETAIQLLQMGMEYTQMHGITYTHILFMLSKLMAIMASTNNSQEVQSLLSQSSQMVEIYNGNPGPKEHLRVFLLVILVSQHLKNGRVKSAKNALKQLQVSIQNINELSDQDLKPSNNLEQFEWLPKDHLCILAFLVSVMHSVQGGHMEKAQKYTDKALFQIDKLRQLGADLDSPVLQSLELFLCENSVMCYLVIGSKENALKEIYKVMKLLEKSPHLLSFHRAQLHILIAICAMSMNNLEAAESQFLSAIKHSNGKEILTFANLNLAIVYIRCERKNDFNAIMDKVNPDSLPDHQYSLRAAGYYVLGLKSFFGGSHDEGKRYLRETLKMANAEDLNRLTSCSLVLLGHIFLALGSPREALNMVSPAMQLASKIPDAHLQLWASSILKDVHRQFGDTKNEQESKQSHSNFSQTLMKDHNVATKIPQSAIFKWTDGPFPKISESPTK